MKKHSIAMTDDEKRIVAAYNEVLLSLRDHLLDLTEKLGRLVRETHCACDEMHVWHEEHTPKNGPSGPH